MYDSWTFISRSSYRKQKAIRKGGFFVVQAMKNKILGKSVNYLWGKADIKNEFPGKNRKVHVLHGGEKHVCKSGGRCAAKTDASNP